MQDVDQSSAFGGAAHESVLFQAVWLRATSPEGKNPVKKRAVGKTAASRKQRAKPPTTTGTD
jgi:hypothetical protein